MTSVRVMILVWVTMIAFAGNSLLCRAALQYTAIDPASFTSIRLLSGAAMLWLLVRVRHGAVAGSGNWRSAAALFAYAAGFSFAYQSLTTATGALLLFGAIQLTMTGYGLWRGERLQRLQVGGLLLACGGVVGLLLPGLSAPPLFGSILMLGAGVAWGVYSLRGQGAVDPDRTIAGNFLRAVPFALVLSFFTAAHPSLDTAGLCYAVFSGAIASGLGYILWYSVLPALTATGAANVQLSVPVLAAFGGSVFLGEPITQRLVVASAAVLGGILLVILKKRPAGVDPA
jgi:drug/metabolite transporter (DMT)-like permease